MEGVAAVGQTIPNKKEELDSLIHREIPKIFLQIGDTVYEAASPGKAFENTKQKMVCTFEYLNFDSIEFVQRCLKFLNLYFFMK